MHLDDNAIQDVTLVTQLPSDSWFEGFAMRPNGRILCTRLDQPELYTFDTDNEDSQLELLCTFEDASGLINLTPVPGANDEYLVISGCVDMKAPRFDGFKLWRVALDPEDKAKPTMTLLRELNECGFPMGVMPFDDQIWLVPDSFKACIYAFNLTTGAHEVLVTDEAMEPASKEDYFGINRIRVMDDMIWFTNSSGGVLGRVQVAKAEGTVSGLKTISEVDILTRDLTHCDGLAISQDKTAVYTASYMNGLLWKVTIDPETGDAETSVVMQNLVSPTAVELSYSSGKPRLYVVCCGEIDVGWINDDNKSWSDMAKINESVEVSVTTTEEKVEYS